MEKKITLITNSAKILCFCLEYENVDIFLTGGKLNHITQSMQGVWTKENLKKYSVNYAIFACKGLDISKGIKDGNEEEAEIKKIMIQCAEKVILMADSTKFNKSSFVDLLSFSEINFLATDSSLSKEWATHLKKNKIEIL